MNEAQTRHSTKRFADLSRVAGLAASLLAACHAERAEPAPRPLPNANLATPSASANANGPNTTPSARALTSAEPLSSAESTSSAAPAVTTASAPEPAASAASAPSTHHYVVAAVGDSLTDPRSHGGGYLAYVQSRCPNLELDNFGKGATMVVQMRRSFDEQIAHSPKPYTHLVVFGGVNDLYSDLTAHRTPEKIENDLGYMYDAARARGMKVVALTVAPWGGFTRYFNESRARATHTVNDWIRARPAAGQVDFVIDAYALLSCGDPDVLCDRFFTPFKDGIHFGHLGHELLGEALYRAVFSDCS